MSFSVKLQDAMAFNIVWLVVGLALLAGAGILFFCIGKLRPAPKKKKVPAQVFQSGPGFYALKKEYLFKIDKLAKKRSKNRITLRDAYQELSTIAREYVQKVTGEPTLKMSLYELEDAGKRINNIKNLTTLVTEYYEPEFAKWSDADFVKSCTETRRMIEKWL